MLREVQKVYRLQGVDINDKHIEVIVRQMLKKIKIEVGGDTEYLPGTLVDVLDYNDVNEKMLAEGKAPAQGTQVMLGSMMGGSARLITSDGIGTIYFGYMGEANLKQPEPSEPAEPVTHTFTAINAMTTPTDIGYYMTLVDEAGNQLGIHVADTSVVANGVIPMQGIYPLAASADDEALVAFTQMIGFPAGSYINIADSYYLSAGKEYKFAAADLANFPNDISGIAFIVSPSEGMCFMADMYQTGAPIFKFADGSGQVVVVCQNIPFNFGSGIGGLM
jgi:hypothetical protein